MEADESVVVEQSSMATQTLVELVWRDRLPLGMNLLTNDDSGYLKVVDFPRGSQARGVCERRQLDPDQFKGARIVAVNGSEYENQEELFDALKDPSRPKTVMFQLADADEAKSVADFVQSSQATREPKEEIAPHTFSTRSIQFDDPSNLGVEFSINGDNFALEVTAFVEGDDGIVGGAERCGEIVQGDILTHVNGTVAVGFDESGSIRAIDLLKKAVGVKPLRLTFSNNYLFNLEVNRDGDHDLGGPQELVLEQHRTGSGGLRVTIKSLTRVSGVAENNGILIGDHLVFVNGVPVGAGARWLGESTAPSFEGVLEMLSDASYYPIGLTFARPRRNDNRWDVGRFSDAEADTFCVTADSYSQLGCVFQATGYHEIVVSDFEAVPGVINHQISSKFPSRTDWSHIAVESINGELVPSYASVSMVKSAMSRSWGRELFKLLLCDDEQRERIRDLRVADNIECE